MARTWPAYKRWWYAKGGMDYLAEKIGTQKVRVYLNGDKHIHPESNVGYSFASVDNKSMPFTDFL